MESATNRYGQRGVSASKEDVHEAIRHIDKGIFPRAFCKVVPDMLAGDPAFCTIMHADGAGTKSSLAYIYWRETGDLSVWKGIAQDAIVMNVDDLLCVGATGPIQLSSTIGRNKNRIPGDVITAIIRGTEEVLAMLRSHGLEIYSTGGETADVGDLVRTVIVDSTVQSKAIAHPTDSRLLNRATSNRRRSGRWLRCDGLTARAFQPTGNCGTHRHPCHRSTTRADR